MTKYSVRSHPGRLTQRLTGLANRGRLIHKVGQPIRSTHKKVNLKKGQPFRSTQNKGRMKKNELEKKS